MGEVWGLRGSLTPWLLSLGLCLFTFNSQHSVNVWEGRRGTRAHPALVL